MDAVLIVAWVVGDIGVVAAVAAPPPIIAAGVTAGMLETVAGPAVEVA